MYIGLKIATENNGCSTAKALHIRTLQWVGVLREIKKT